MRYDTLAFDTGGTVLDWHGSLVDELARVPAWQGQPFDRHAFANAWRRSAMKGIVGQARPAFNMDDVHLRALDDTVQAFGLPSLAEQSRHDLWRAWHRLQAWPDFAPALARLRQRVPVVSFTMLPTSLVIDVSRQNGLTWDAIVSCEMIGVYKPHREAYVTAARWLNLAPDRILMVACHNFDLNAAHEAGLRTAFVARPDEWGPAGPPDPQPNMAYDYIVDGFAALCDQVLSTD